MTDGDADAAIAPPVADLPFKLARLREGVYGSGMAVEPSMVRRLPRLAHLVAQEADLTGEVAACCGVTFAPETLDIVPWGDRWPHVGCVRRCPVDRSELEESFCATELGLCVDDSQMEQGFQTVETIMGSRSDWVIEEYSDDWTYTTSFNGVLDDERRFPRLVDMGLEYLIATLARPHVFRIYSCGVRDGCPKHVIYTETYSLDEVRLIEERLSVHEIRASSIDLAALAWCLIFGECSRTKLEYML